MKRLLVPTMFLLALTGSAFTRYSSSHARFVNAFYEDALGNCDSWQIPDGDCSADPLDYVCTENILGAGWETMYEYNLGSLCYQPLYTVYP
jgi:hypothetical protein